MSKVDKNDIIYFKEACDQTYATSKGADENGLVQQTVNGTNVYPKTLAGAVTLPDGTTLEEAIQAGGGSLGGEEVTISNGVEPEDSDIWIDTSEEPEAAISIEDAPKDGKIYGRKDGQWAAPTLTYSEIEASTWVEDSTYEDFTYRCDLSCSGVLETDYAEVVFNVIEATSGVYAPVCRTSTDTVSIWASENTTITVPTIIITR